MDQNKLAQNKLDLYSSFNKSCIRNILHLKYKNDENCSICLLPMLNKLVLHTPCQHYFHYTCIKSVYTSQYIYKYKCPLCRYDLTNAIFNSINIQHKPLGANVMGANVMGANTMGANVMGANAMGANVMGANVMGANVMGANVMGANVMGANAMGANVMGANAMGRLDSFDLNIWLLDLFMLDISVLDISAHDLVDEDGNEIVINSQIHRQLINVVSTVINLIKYSFHPECFRMMMLSNLTLNGPIANGPIAIANGPIANEPIICHLCNYKFLNYLHSEESIIQIDDHSYEIINEYITSHPTILNLINDVIQIMDFETIQHAIDFIYLRGNNTSFQYH